MLSHVFLIFPLIWNTSRPDDSTLWLQLAMFSPFRIIWAGHEAVIFFFCLSGFVLALPFFRSFKQQPYLLYLAKRILRIYPPYLAAALLAIGCREIFFDGIVPTTSGWFNQSWQSPISSSILIDHILMVGSFKNCDFNPILWSLVHEMRISIYFPVIMWALKKRTEMYIILPIAFTALYQFSISAKYRGMISIDHDYFETIYYTSFFILGAYLAKHRLWLVNKVSDTNKNIKLLFLIAALLLYTNAFWLPHFVPSENKSFIAIVTRIWFKDWMAASAVSVFIIFSMSSKFLSRTLASKALVFLGSISYSLYLFHALVLKVIVTIFHQTMPLAATIGIAVPLVLLISIVSWKYIEVPSIQLSKYISNWWVSNPKIGDSSRVDN